MVAVGLLETGARAVLRTGTQHRMELPQRRHLLELVVEVETGERPLSTKEPIDRCANPFEGRWVDREQHGRNDRSRGRALRSPAMGRSASRPTVSVVVPTFRELVLGAVESALASLDWSSWPNR